MDEMEKYERLEVLAETLSDHDGAEEGEIFSAYATLIRGIDEYSVGYHRSAEDWKALYAIARRKISDYLHNLEPMFVDEILADFNSTLSNHGYDHMTVADVNDLLTDYEAPAVPVP